MLPQGTRPAATPRATTETRCAASPRIAARWRRASKLPAERQVMRSSRHRRDVGEQRDVERVFDSRAHCSRSSRAHPLLLARRAPALARRRRAIASTSFANSSSNCSLRCRAKPADLQHASRRRRAPRRTQSLRREVYSAGRSPSRMRIAASSTIDTPRSRFTWSTVYWRRSGNEIVSPAPAPSRAPAPSSAVHGLLRTATPIPGLAHHARSSDERRIGSSPR